MTEINKTDVVELALAHGFLGPPTGGVQTELQCGCKAPATFQGEEMDKTDYWTVLDSFLNCVEYQRREPVDIGDDAIMQRLRNTKKFIKEYKESIENIDNSVGEDGGKVEEEEEETEATRSAAATLPVPTVDAETEKLLRSSRAIHRQTAGLRSFLTDLLSGEARGENLDLQSCPVVEEPSVSQMLSPIRVIAEKMEELRIHEEYPAAILPDHIQISLDKCTQMLSSVDKSDDQRSLDIPLSEQLDTSAKYGE